MADPSVSVKQGMLLSALRVKGVVTEAPEYYSPKSWVRAANHCAAEGQAFEAQYKLEDAFVAYLRGLGCFEAFTKHREYPDIKAQGSKLAIWQEATKFQANRQIYIDRAKMLADKLKLRDVEKAVPNGSSISKPPKPLPSNKPAKPLPIRPASLASASSPKTGAPSEPLPGLVSPPNAPVRTPQTASSTQSFATANDISSEPDVSAGGSIAARLAALRGAGMRTGLNGVNGGQDAAVDSGAMRSAATGSSSGGGHSGGRRGSNASVVQSFAGLKLESSGTGESSTLKQPADSRPGGQFGSSYANYRERHGSGPPTPILSPNPSGTVSQADTAPPSASPGGDSPSNGKSPNPSTRSLPSVPNHFHKSSLPNVPTPSTTHFPHQPSSAARSRQGTFSNKQNVPPSIQEDELGNFSTHFPSLTDLEADPAFTSITSPSSPSTPADLPGHPLDPAKEQRRMPRSPLAEETGFSFPNLPSTPTHRPGLPALQGRADKAADGTQTSRDEPPGRPGSRLENSSSGLRNEPQRISDTSTFSQQEGTPGLSGRFQLNPRLYDRSIPDVKPISTAIAPTKPKPTLPFGNSITPSRLHDYLTKTSLDILVIDTRSHQDFEHGHVGPDSDPNEGRKARTIWIDSTVLNRAGMTSSKMEDSLALSTPADQAAFADRAKADLIVLYDDSSTAFSAVSAIPSPPSALFSIIYEKEFSKTLKRTPVLLVGGYRAWMAELEKTDVSGARPAVPLKKSTLPPLDENGGSPEAKTSRRETQVYRAAPPTSNPSYSRNITENLGAPNPQSMAGMTSGPDRKAFMQSASAGPSSYTSRHNIAHNDGPTPPPAATISPGRVARKSSDYAEHHTQPYAGYSAHAPRASMDYGSGHPGAPQPPPAAVAPGTARQDTRPQPPRRSSTVTFDNLTRLPAGQDMLYWSEVGLGISGLKNLGNTCYMNSTLQCLSATYPLARFFRDGSFRKAINTTNPMGTKGDLARAFATLISMLWEESFTFLSPVTFRKSISQFAPQFAGTDQHDSQEFLSFLLDGLHEDLSRVHQRPPPVEMTPEREAALETLPPAIAADKEWRIYKQRNNSLIVDLFQGQYRNRMECLTCHQTSTTYDSFMYLSLPVPRGKDAVVLQQLIDEFVKTEILSGDDAWNCPRCKTPRRATKSLSIARLPPVLLVHLKRFSTKDGHFWDKSETPVIFPVKSLDMTHYLPPSRGPNIGPGDDPMSQNGPFKFDLFAVSNHMGSLSNGHYTAFVNSSTGWQYCDDSKITLSAERDVITKPAYILFYKRVINT